MLILLIFMYIFAFKIYSIIDSTIIVGLILTGILMFNKEYRKKVFNGLKNKYILYLIIGMIILLLWSIMVLFINKTQDLSYLKTLIHLYITLGIGYELFFYLDLKNKKNEVINYIIISFLIQSFLQWFFFLFPSVSSLFNIFRTESMILNNIKYSGYRGLAISSTGFFGLSSAYGLVSIIYFTKYNTLFKNNILKYIVFFLLYSGTFFAGRTGFIALPFILILLIADLKNNRQNKEIYRKKLKQLGIVFLSFLLIILLTMQIPKFSKMYNYVFELVKNISNGKGFFTTSTDKLIKMYDIDISSKTFFVGDGKYTVFLNGEPKYYQGTDVGYLRKILYFGIIGILLSFVLEILIFDIKNKNKEQILIFIFLMILELKGEIIGFSLLVNSILFLYNLSFVYYEKPKTAIEQSTNNSKNNKEYLISVVVPVYNCERFLTKTIDSILNQTYKNLEIIIVDDGSTDQSKKILKEKYANDKRIKIFYQKNLGAPTARNKGYEKAKGDLIIFFDSDDYMEESYLSRILTNYNGEDLIIANYFSFMDDKIIKQDNFKFNSDLTFEENLYLISPFPGNKVYKKNIIKKYKISFDNVKIGQDLNFYIKYLQHTKKVKIVDDAYVFYRIHQNSISRTYNMNLLDIEKSISMATNDMKTEKIYLARMLRIKHYTTQLLKLENYDKENANNIRKYFKKNAKKHKIFKIDYKYKVVMKKYIIYELFIFLAPYSLIKKINRIIKGGIIS